jgi:anti-sigma B factor antagonist
MPSSLTLQRSLKDDVAVISIDGFLDAHTAPQFEQALQQEIADGRVKLVVDCAKLTYISSAGLGVFMGFIEEVREQGGDIKVCGLTPKVRQVFDILGFDTIFELFENLQSAVDRFGADSSQTSREAR